jgi:hypothetical protein
MLTWKQEKTVASFDDSFFSFVDESNELIQPELSKWDKWSIWQRFVRDVKDMVMDQAQIRNLKGSVDDEALAAYRAAAQEIEKEMPRYMLYDAFNLYNTPHENVKIRPVPDDQQWWFDMLKDHFNNTYMKMLSKNNTLYSYLSAAAVLKRIFVQKNDPNKPNNPDDSQMRNIMQDAQQEVERQINDFEELAGGAGKGFDPGEVSLEDMDRVMELWNELKNFPIKSEAVTRFINTTLKMSESYFSSQYTEKEIEVLEADSIEDLQGLENLMDPLRRIHLEDFITHERKYHMKFDVYVDLSGSMSSGAYYSNSKEGRISKYKLAKLTAMRLKMGDHVEDVYTFDTNVAGPHKSMTTFLRTRMGGGTTLNNCFRKILTTGRPGLVITDAEDWDISVYTEKAYIIGISGASFSHFKDTKAGRKFLDNKQCILHMPKDNTFRKADHKHVKASQF